MSILSFEILHKIHEDEIFSGVKHPFYVSPAGVSVP